MKKKLLIPILILIAFIIGALVCFLVIPTVSVQGETGISILEMINAKLVYVFYGIGAFLLLCMALTVIFALLVLFKGKSGDTKKGGGKGRFARLSQIDEEKKRYKAPEYEKQVTLESFCRRFREYAASELKLYYSEEDIRAFVAGLGVSKFQIMQGMSGTGKTSLAYALGKFLQNDSAIIPVLPMWKERADTLGYFNEFTGRFNETPLLEKLYEAGYTDEMCVVVLDEMNIARVEYYFAEFLSLLELPDPDARLIDVVFDRWKHDPKHLERGRLRIPTNVWFIGTANNDDSTFAISDKVYDRAMIMNMDQRAQPFKAPGAQAIRISASAFEELCAKAQEQYTLSEESLAKLETLDAFLAEHLRITFGNRIMKQIKAYVSMYVACGGTEEQALDDIVCKKVFRKMEALNPMLIKNVSVTLEEELDRLWGKKGMPQCRKALARLLMLS